MTIGFLITGIKSKGMNPPESYTTAMKAAMTDIHESEVVQTPYANDLIKPTAPTDLPVYGKDTAFKAWVATMEPLLLKTLSQAHLNLFYYAFKAGEGQGKQKAIDHMVDKFRRVFA